MTFQETFRTWKGGRPLKICADVLGVPYWTMVRWVYGDAEPHKYIKAQILKKMEDNPATPPVSPSD